MTAAQALAPVLVLAGLVPAAGAGLAGLRFRHRIEVIGEGGVLAVTGMFPCTACRPAPGLAEGIQDQDPAAGQEADGGTPWVRT